MPTDIGRVQHMDASTQTDIDQPRKSLPNTLSITIPHSQLSFFQFEETGKGKKDSKRMSAIIVSASPDGSRNKDDMSVVSISLPHRYSVTSVKSLRSSDRLGLRRSSTPTAQPTTLNIKQEQNLEGDMLREKLVTPKPSKELETSSEITHASSDAFVPVPASTAVEPASPISTAMSSFTARATEEVIPSSASFREASNDIPMMDQAPRVYKSLCELPKLPPLGFSDYLSTPGTASSIEALVSQWPVLKSGVVFRKDVLPSSATSSSRNDRNPSNRLVSRSFSNLLKSMRKSKEHCENGEPRGSSEEDEWNIYYAEVRGRYLMFYAIHDLPLPEPRSESKQQQGLQRSGTALVSLSARNSRSTLMGPPGNQMRDALLQKPLAKLFHSLGKRNKPSQKQILDHSNKREMRDERLSLEGVSRMSSDQRRNFFSSFSPENIKNLQRTLVRYIPLQQASVEQIPRTKAAMMLMPNNRSSISSVMSAASSGSVLVVNSTPIERQHEVNLNPAECDQILMDVLLHDDVMDAYDADQLTISTVNSSSMRDSPSRQREFSEWVAAISTASDLNRSPNDIVKPNGSDGAVTIVLEDSPLPRRRSGQSSSTNKNFKDTSSISSGRTVRSKHSAREASSVRREQSVGSAVREPVSLDVEDRVSDIEQPQDNFEVVMEDSVGEPSPVDIQSDESSERRPEAPIRGSSLGSPLQQHHQQQGKSFAKMLSGRWKMTFEKEREQPRARPVISGPSNFQKVEMTPEMMLQGMTAVGPRPTDNLRDIGGVNRESAEPQSFLTESSRDRDRSGKSYEDRDRKRNERSDKHAGFKRIATEDAILEKERVHAKKEREREKKREAKEAKEKARQLKAAAIHGRASAGAAPAAEAHKLRVNSYSSVRPMEDDQPSLSTSRLFFPFLNKSLFASSKEKELPIPVNELLQRSGTMSSRASTVRRRVGRSKRESCGTTTSERTIGSVPVETDVPLALRKCITLLDEIGLDAEGLYRIPGTATSIERLRRLFILNPANVHLQSPPNSPLPSALESSATDFITAKDIAPALPHRSSRLSLTDTVSSSVRSSLDGPKCSPLVAQDIPRRASRARRLSTSSIPQAAFSGAALYDHDVHVVAGVIKGFLREGLGPKKIPVCTFDLYERFISATQMGDWRARMIAIQDLVHSLPANHFATLKLVCEHLARVASHSEKNRMSVRNLAIIFGPSLLKPPPALDSMARIIEDMPFQCTLVETLIEQVEWVFGPIEFEEIEEVWEEEEGGASVEVEDETVPEVKKNGSDARIESSGEHETAPVENDARDESEQVDEDDDVASNAGVVGSAHDSEPEDRRQSERSPPVYNPAEPPFAIERAFPSSSPSEDRTQSPVASQPPSPALSSPTTSRSPQQVQEIPLAGPRLRQTKSKMDRRRGQLLPMVYLSDMRESAALSGSIPAYSASVLAQAESEYAQSSASPPASPTSVSPTHPLIYSPTTTTLPPATTATTTSSSTVVAATSRSGTPSPPPTPPKNSPPHRQLSTRASTITAKSTSSSSSASLSRRSSHSQQHASQSNNDSRRRSRKDSASTSYRSSRRGTNESSSTARMTRPVTNTTSASSSPESIKGSSSSSRGRNGSSSHGASTTAAPAPAAAGGLMMDMPRLSLNLDREEKSFLDL